MDNYGIMNYSGGRKMKILWKCSICSFVHEGEHAPITCPKCGVSQEKYVKLDDASTNVIRRSDFTNDLHMELVTLSMKMEILCNKGIEDALDPTCVVLFTKATQHAWEIKQMGKAELSSHLSKEKF